MSLKATIEAARSYLAPQDVDCVVYHYPCSDGAGAALSAWTKLGNHASYERLCYETPFNEDNLRNKNVILIDCSLKPQQLQKVRSIARKVAILDHHDSAMKTLSGEPGCFFYMGNSGAMLAWHYFHGLDTMPPMLIQLIEDRDLWRWSQREQSEPLFYGLIDRHPDIDFKQYEQYLDPANLQAIIEHGKSLMAANNQWCAETALQAEIKDFSVPGSAKSYRIICQELETYRLVSELAEYLYTRNQVDFVMFWYPLAENKYKLSFRTGRDDINLGEIATSLGGGGHPKAAGAVVADPQLLFN